MAVKPQYQFPLFAPPPLCPYGHRPITEIRFSRWNNANAQKFDIPKRTQKQLEDQIRIQKRFDSARTIAENFNPAPPHPTTFKSVGTPSAPSPPSIPGKKSKYSKPHPAFERLTKSRKFPAIEKTPQISDSPNFKIDENGISYELPDAPFLYQYSYTETPTLKPVKLREPLVSPFGPTTMAKPWLGRKPLPPSKKKLPEFDSFKLPPPHKKGVKPVQAPGPFLPGSGPKYVRSREEVLGAPLSKEEVEDLINSCKKSSRQLNIGRDGLTHNMLDNIHDLWKRKRVCKIKCKGVCTVDMNNVCQQLEERTGGKIIYHRGGVIYLFRGRNYNYKSRPRFPLMLWKPIAPVYPRLIKRVPEGLTLEEVTEMRKKGSDLIPICKLAKNGVYCDLVKNVREAFEACELVRINCQGLNPSDYKKIGAKLKDLVPCVLLSFEFEHILMWRGQDWKSSLTEPIEQSKGLLEVNANPTKPVASLLPNSQGSSSMEANFANRVTDSSPNCGNGKSLPGEDASTKLGVDGLSQAENLSSISVDEPDEALEKERALNGFVKPQTGLENAEPSMTIVPEPRDEIAYTKRNNQHVDEGILLLRKQAIESGLALTVDDHRLDADNVLKEAAAFAKVAPPGPVFPCRPRRADIQESKNGKSKEQDNSNSRRKELPAGLAEEEIAITTQSDKLKTSRNDRMDGVRADYLNVVPKGSLRVDELAKLLA